MRKTALLVVDVQEALIEEKPFNQEKVIENIKNLISEARESKKEVIYIRHNDEELEHGSIGWQIYSEIEPLSHEKIFDKQYNSAFLKTCLKEYLEEQGIDTLILVGLQTEYCIDATCKSGFEQGYNMIIPADTNTTYDNEYLSAERLYTFYNYTIWNNRFAKVLPIEVVEEKLRK